MNGGKRLFSDVELIEALIRNQGNIGRAAESLDVTRQAVQQRINANQEIKDRIDDYKDCRVDNAESALDKAIDLGEGWAVVYTLKTLGRKRGYIEGVNEYLLQRLEDLERLARERDNRDRESNRTDGKSAGSGQAVNGTDV